MRVQILLAAVFVCAAAVAQNIPINPNQTINGKRHGKWTQFIDKDWKEIPSRTNASYYRIIEYNQGVPQGIVRDHFISGKVQFEGHLLSENPDVNDGLCTWYLEDGTKSKESTYKNGVLEGPTVNYFQGKKYSEAVYSNNKPVTNWTYYGDDFNSHYQTGLQLRDARQFAKAETSLMKARDAAIKEFGQSSVRLVNVYWVLVLMYQEMDQPANVRKAYDNVLKAFNAVSATASNDDKSDFIELTENVGKFFARRKLPEQAIRSYKTAASLRMKFGMTSDLGYYNDLRNMMEYMYAAGQPDSIGYYFETLAPVAEKDEAAYVKHLRDWTSFLVAQGGTNKFDPVARRFETYLNEKQVKNQKDETYAGALVSYGSILWLTGQNQRAIKSYTDARQVMEPMKATKKEKYADIFYYVSRLYNTEKKYDATADKWFADYEKLIEEYGVSLGAGYKDGMIELINYYFQKKNYTKAEDYTRRTMKFMEQGKGYEDDPEYRMMPMLLAGILEKQGRMAESEAIVKGLTKKDEKLLIETMGLDDSQKTVNELGKYLANAEYLKAIAIFEKYRRLLTSHYEKRGDYSSLISSNLAVVYCYRQTGDMNRAEELLLSLNALAQEKLSKNDPSYNLTLWNTGDFYLTMGSMGMAEQYFRAALINLNETRTEQNKKENDEQYYNILARLASVYKTVGNTDEAEKLYFKVLDYKQSVYGVNSIDYQSANAVLGDLYHSMHLYAIAEKIYDEAEAVYRKEGVNTSRYMQLMGSMAINYQVRGNYAKAEPMYVKLKDYYARTLGKKSDAYSVVLTDIAIFYYHSNQWDKATEAYNELNSISLYKIDNFFGSLSEREKGIYYSQLQRNFNKFNSFAIHRAQKDPASAGAIYDIQLATKGLLFRSTNRVKETILGGKDDSLKAQYMRWQTKKEALSKVYQMSDAEKKVAGVDEKAMEISVNQLEKDLTKRSGQFASLIQLRPDWKQVQKRLKPGEAAIEMIRIRDAIPSYKYFYFGKGFNIDSVKNDYSVVSEIVSDRTAVARAGVKERDIVMEINDQVTKGKTVAQLDDLVGANPVKLKLKRPSTSSVFTVTVSADSVFSRTYANPTLYAALIITPESTSPELVMLNNGDQMESRYLSYYRNAIRTRIDDQYSYNVFWKPIREKLKNSKTVFFSPDGVYNSINLNTLYNTTSGKYVLDEINLIMVSNTSDLLSDNSSQGATKVVLIGYPDYNKSGVAAKSGQESATDFVLLKSDTTQRFMSDNVVTELPGTQVEVNTIEKVFQRNKSDVNKLISTQASEENLKSIHSPRVLHIATHGFFMDEIPANANERGMTGVSIDRLKENPLLRSGLLLAGAGNTIANGKQDSQAEDGILTAYEAMNLDLQKTELVVLSACETGLGQVRAGEGVYGLQRAFRSAGAQSVLMSLWKVDDTATQQLMTEFYQQWQSSNARQASFHDAQVKLRATFAHPYYWGAFVMTGR